MQILLAIALKSLLIAGLTLGLLQLLRKHSASERSWVAHIGLLALILLAFAPIVMPRWTVETPALFGTNNAPDQGDTAAPRSRPIVVSPTATVLPANASPIASRGAALSPTLIATALYAVPAAILLFITALALARLIALRARADVLVDGHWLSALARAQRRMGFKHGTALLTSDDLSSPISWGLLRPVILLNSRAVEASSEAEAIIAHELAHVARMDWAKLLLARITTALFWFNPLVWLLAREAHQLREETADDAVLAADIVDTDYAQLLAQVARHECPGLLLGAHGVAPSKGSLHRRIRRVLDGASVRGPAARPFAFGVLAGAVLVSAPLAALTFIPAGTSKDVRQSPAAAARRAYAASEPADLPHLIATGVTASVNSAIEAAAPSAAPQPAVLAANPQIQVTGSVARALADARSAQAAAVARIGAGTAVSAVDSVAVAAVASRANRLSQKDMDEIIELKSSGVTADFVTQMRAASPALARLDAAEFVGLRNVGVTPQYVREMVAAGFARIGPDELTEAKAVGVSSSYAHGLINAGVRADIDEIVQLRAVGVPLEFIQRIRAAGYPVRDADKLLQMWALGIDENDLRVRPHGSLEMRRPPPDGWLPSTVPRSGST